MNGESRQATLKGLLFASGAVAFGLFLVIFAEVNTTTVFGIDHRNTQQIIKEAKKDASGWSNAGKFRVKNQIGGKNSKQKKSKY